MDKSFAASGEKLGRYTLDLFNPEDPTLAEIRRRCERAGLRPIQVGAMDALHLEVLTRAVGARRAVEIGTLGGYSGTAIARGLQPGGRLYSCELEPVNAEVARQNFKFAGVDDRVEVLVGPALETLPGLVKHAPFDLVFVDADKESYPRYLEWAAHHLRLGGVLLGDNTFGFGMIADEVIADVEDRAAVEALRVFNHELARGARFRATMLPTGEGLTMAVRIR